jgi:putative two-component system response regulator
MPRILIADDDALIRRFLEQALEYGGYDCVSAADGTDAISILETDAAVDVVVTDYAMPGASGIEVIEHARRLDPTLPCIIVTAFRDLELAMRAMQVGAIGFVPKPFKSEHLLTVVGHAMERRSLALEAMRLRVLTPMLERFTMLLSNTLEGKDTSTRHHSERLVALSDRIAETLGLDGERRASIRLGACLHDIGKVGIPEHLLRKLGPLTEDEFSVIRQHPEIGAAILEDIDTWEEVRGVVLHHHEHFNGKGYPRGLQGPAIPQGARIVGVVDAFDVMRMGRPYAPPKPIDRVVEELRAQRGEQFDPDCVDILLDLIAADEPSIALASIGRRPPGWPEPNRMAADSATG